jgi:hypothetical protein
MNLTVIDNFLEEDLIKYLEKIFVSETPHYYGHASIINKSAQFYSSNININDALIKYLIIKLKKQFAFNEILRSYINVQYHGMSGDWHRDDGNRTILLMITKTLEKGSGQFEIKDNDKITQVDFIQNRIIAFEANKLHKGLDPKEINTPRITLAFKTI